MLSIQIMMNGIRTMKNKEEETNLEEILENNKRILEGVLSQINSFDSKAGILISIMSIVFGLSLTLLDFLKTNELGSCKYIVFSIVYLLFVISIIASIILSVLVIIPRGRPKNAERNNINYYMDLSEMEYDEFKDNRKKFNDINDPAFFKQIKTNAQICEKKHKFLLLSIIAMIPAALFMITLILLVIHFMF